MKKAFTIIELLIVIGIIAVLAALVLPVLTSVRERALSAQCKSNLHQLAEACLNYSMKEGVLPWGMIDPGTHDAQYWKTPSFRLIFPREDPGRHGVERWSDYSSFC